MMQIKQHQRKWRLTIREEEWEFNSKVEMIAIVSYLTDLKERYGDLRKKQE